MVHLNIDRLVDQFTPKDRDYLTWIHQHDHTVLGCVTVDNRLYSPFIDKSGNRYYAFMVVDFGEDYKQRNGSHRYSIRLFGREDGVLCREISDLNQFYQWIQLFEYRDFTVDDIQKYIDGGYC